MVILFGNDIGIISVAIDNGEYDNFILELKNAITTARSETIMSVNKKIIDLYYLIGSKVAYKLHHGARGDTIVENISSDIKKSFPGVQGFSKQNIWNMVKFCEFYTQHIKLQPLAGEISWSNNVIILEKCSELSQIEYYLKLSKKLGLSKRVLQNKIENKDFEQRVLDTKNHNLDLTLDESYAQLVHHTIKESYVFDFLDLGDMYREKELEQGLIHHLKKFILELGIGFAYVGNQYNLKLQGDDYFLDLLFYHTKLKCYIVIELKIGIFMPEYAGKLNFYISLVDDQIKDSSDQPTIGLLICKEKDDKVVEYALRGQSQPMVVSQYSFEGLPIDLQQNLPTEEMIQKFLDNF